MRKAIYALAGTKELRIAFIPTAANAEAGDKAWLIQDFVDARRLGTVDIVDIAALEKQAWLPRLQQANIIVVGGGNTTYLMHTIVRSGLKDELADLLRERVYVGISAGSIVLSKQLQASSEYLYGDEAENAPPGLGYVDFHVRPHLNSPHFPLVRSENLRALAPKLQGKLYAIDDETAIQVVDGKMTVISEGVYEQYN